MIKGSHHHNGRSALGRHKILFFISLFVNVLLSYKLWSVSSENDFVMRQSEISKQQVLESHQKQTSLWQEINAGKSEIQKIKVEAERLKQTSDSYLSKLQAQEASTENCMSMLEDCKLQKEEFDNNLSSRNSMVEKLTSDLDNCKNLVTEKVDAIETCSKEKQTHLAEVQRLKLELENALNQQNQPIGGQQPGFQNQPQVGISNQLQQQQQGGVINEVQPQQQGGAYEPVQPQQQGGANNQLQQGGADLQQGGEDPNHHEQARSANENPVFVGSPKQGESIAKTGRGHEKEERATVIITKNADQADSPMDSKGEKIPVDPMMTCDFTAEKLDASCKMNQGTVDNLPFVTGETTDLISNVLGDKQISYIFFDSNSVKEAGDKAEVLFGPIESSRCVRAKVQYQAVGDVEMIMKANDEIEKFLVPTKDGWSTQDFIFAQHDGQRMFEIIAKINNLDFKGALALSNVQFSSVDCNKEPAATKHTEENAPNQIQGNVVEEEEEEELEGEIEKDVEENGENTMRRSNELDDDRMQDEDFDTGENQDRNVERMN